MALKLGYNGDMFQAVKDAFVKQALPILASAAVAAGFTFVQSLLAAGGYCPAPAASVETVGALGGMFKAGHSLVYYLSNARA